VEGQSSGSTKGVFAAARRTDLGEIAIARAMVGWSAEVRVALGS
jgi:hypothetical protein